MNMAEAQRELYKYNAEWPIYGMNWSNKRNKPMRLAIGSFIEEYTNKVRIIELNAATNRFERTGQIDHPYPTTKIQWLPDKEDSLDIDLIATSGDYLRIWKMNESGVDPTLECLLNNNKSSEFCAPLTSFDWNETDPSIIGTSSIDTTCTIWDVNTNQRISQTAKVEGSVKTQLIAHDQEVYDIAFAQGVNIFASVGADGSVRMFDLRKLEHSNILYEDADQTPLLRLDWNKEDNNYLATIKMDDASVIILDIRAPAVPVAVLSNHEACVNGIAWAPHSSTHMCTAADDKKALIWDISQMPKKCEPILAYDAEGPINQIKWSAAHPDWIAICYDQTLEVLRV